jgi:hypothetical protein
LEFPNCLAIIIINYTTAIIELYQELGVTTHPLFGSLVHPRDQGNVVSNLKSVG